MGAVHFSGPITSKTGVVVAPNPVITVGVDQVAGTPATTFPSYYSTAVTDGTDTATTATSRRWVRVFVPHNCTLTGIGITNGTAVGTDKVIVELKDSAGVHLANSATAGTTCTGTGAVQKVPFTATLDVAGPAYYYIATTYNGTTATYRSIPATATMAANTQITGTVASVFGTMANITPGTTFTADLGPIAFTY